MLELYDNLEDLRQKQNVKKEDFYSDVGSNYDAERILSGCRNQ